MATTMKMMMSNSKIIMTSEASKEGVDHSSLVIDVLLLLAIVMIAVVAMLAI